MITKITGRLKHVREEDISLAVDHFEYQVLIPEFVRRQLRGKVDEQVSLLTLHYLEGNPQHGRVVPRLVGFLAEPEREFFDLFCSVDGVGVRKALRAMVRPIREIATAIQEQDVKSLATLPGVGESTAERIVAKLRKKVAKFALMVDRHLPGAAATPGEAEPDVLHDAFQALRSVGHSDTDARVLLDRALQSHKKFKNVGDLLEEVYRTGSKP